MKSFFRMSTVHKWLEGSHPGRPWLRSRHWGPTGAVCWGLLSLARSLQARIRSQSELAGHM